MSINPDAMGNGQMDHSEQRPVPSPEPVESTPGRELDSGNLQEIRNILFGSQQREYERRFALIEEKFEKAQEYALDNLNKRFATLEHFVKQELMGFSVQMKKATEDQELAAATVNQSIQTMNAVLEKKVSDLDKVHSHAQSELRRHILEQSRELSDEIQVKFKEISVLVDEKIQDIYSEKTDRIELAHLLREVGDRLISGTQKPLPKENEDGE